MHPCRHQSIVFLNAISLGRKIEVAEGRQYEFNSPGFWCDLKEWLKFVRKESCVLWIPIVQPIDSCDEASPFHGKFATRSKFCR